MIEEEARDKRRSEASGLKAKKRRQRRMREDRNMAERYRGERGMSESEQKNDRETEMSPRREQLSRAVIKRRRADFGGFWRGEVPRGQSEMDGRRQREKINEGGSGKKKRKERDG